MAINYLMHGVNKRHLMIAINPSWIFLWSEGYDGGGFIDVTFNSLPW